MVDDLKVHASISLKLTEAPHSQPCAPVNQAVALQMLRVTENANEELRVVSEEISKMGLDITHEFGSNVDPESRSHDETWD